MSDPNAIFKDQMAEARRTQILMGAAQVIGQRGYHKATTKAIAQAAGVSEGTIYNYFGTKRDLLLAMVNMLGAQSLREAVPTPPPNDPKEFLTLILKDRFQLLQSYGHMMAPLMAEIIIDADLREAVYTQIGVPLTAIIEDYLQHHMDTGQLRPANPVIMTRALMGTMILNAATMISGLDPRYADVTPDQLIDEIVSLFLDGLLT